MVYFYSYKDYFFYFVAHKIEICERTIFFALYKRFLIFQLILMKSSSTKNIKNPNIEKNFKVGRILN